MDNKLPNVYAKPLENEIKNNREYYYGKLVEKIYKSPKTVSNSINDIFRRKDFVYKKKVKITTYDEEMIVTLVGRTNKDILTLENKTIPVINITNIEIIE